MLPLFPTLWHWCWIFCFNWQLQLAVFPPAQHGPGWAALFPGKSFPLQNLSASSTTACWLFPTLPTMLVQFSTTNCQSVENMTVIPSWLWSQNTLISKTHDPNVAMPQGWTISKFCHVTLFAVTGWKISTCFKFCHTFSFSKVTVSSHKNTIREFEIACLVHK